MEKLQFRFSITVGIALLALGSVIMTQASIGVPLIALGVAIVAIAVMSNNFAKAKQHGQPALIPVLNKSSDRKSTLR